MSRCILYTPIRNQSIFFHKVKIYMYKQSLQGSFQLGKIFDCLKSIKSLSIFRWIKKNHQPTIIMTDYKVLDRQVWANTADTDQTAPEEDVWYRQWSGSTPFAFQCTKSKDNFINFLGCPNFSGLLQYKDLNGNSMQEGTGNQIHVFLVLLQISIKQNKAWYMVCKFQNLSKLYFS